MMRVEVLYDDERHTVPGRQMPQQFHGSFESASRPADADDRAMQILPGWL